jgi:hypothetical protein
MKIKWNKSSKIPRLFNVNRECCFGSVRGVSQSTKYEAGESKTILMRYKNPKKYRRLGSKGWEDYPNPSAGTYSYCTGHYRRYDDGETEGFEDERGHEACPDEWTYLENAENP